MIFYCQDIFQTIFTCHINSLDAFPFIQLPFLLPWPKEGMIEITDIPPREIEQIPLVQMTPGHVAFGPTPLAPCQCVCHHDAVHFQVLRDVPLPVMPLYDLPTSAAMVPMTMAALRCFLTTHKLMLPPAVYRRDQKRIRHRLLSAYDIRVIRKRTLRGPGLDHYLSLYPSLEGPNHGQPARSE